MATPHDRLRELGIELPAAPPPAANYVPTVKVPIGEGRTMVYVAGQIPRRPDGGMYTGRIPSEVSVEVGQAAARACGIAILAQLEAAGGLDRVEQVVQVIGFVACDPGFGDQPEVVNGCSDLLVAVLGEAGRHTRAAVGTGALPRNVSVEIAAVAVLRT